MPYVLDQYASARDFGIPTDPNVVEPDDSLRCGAYKLYDDFYHNRPHTFRVTLRSDNDTEIYLPSTKKIVNSTARFLAVDFDFQIKGGDTESVDNILRNQIWPREAILRKMIRSKRSYLTRGDQCWFLTADKNKLEGQRISINTIHPGSVFRIENINDPFRLDGYHIVDLVHDPRDKQMDPRKRVARRQTYRKEGNQITFEAGLYEMGCWDDRFLQAQDVKLIKQLIPKNTMPPSITALPVYIIPNNEPDGSSWGLSLVSGIEYIINALNQSITYEDLTLVLQGLGLYATNAAPPVDPRTNKPTTYKLHPGNVIELATDEQFERVDGVTSVAPFQDHLSFLDRWAMDGAGLPAMAAGAINVDVAKSGIALALEMGPIIAENSDREEGIEDTWNQIGYDLINGWLPAFEGIISPDSQFTTIFGDAMPVNRDAVIQEILSLYTADLILADEARKKLEEFGYDYKPGMIDQLLEEATKKALAAGGTSAQKPSVGNLPNIVGAQQNSDGNGVVLSS